MKYERTKLLKTQVSGEPVLLVLIFLFDAFHLLEPWAWFGSVWDGILGGILGGIARAGFSHRESALPDPLDLIIRTVDHKRKNQLNSQPLSRSRSTP